MKAKGEVGAGSGGESWRIREAFPHDDGDKKRKKKSVRSRRKEGV